MDAGPGFEGEASMLRRSGPKRRCPPGVDPLEGRLLLSGSSYLQEWSVPVPAAAIRPRLVVLPAETAKAPGALTPPVAPRPDPATTVAFASRAIDPAGGGGGDGVAQPAVVVGRGIVRAVVQRVLSLVASSPEAGEDTGTALPLGPAADPGRSPPPPALGPAGMPSDGSDAPAEPSPFYFYRSLGSPSGDPTDHGPGRGPAAEIGRWMVVLAKEDGSFDPRGFVPPIFPRPDDARGPSPLRGPSDARVGLTIAPWTQSDDPPATGRGEGAAQARGREEVDRHLARASIHRLPTSASDSVEASGAAGQALPLGPGRSPTGPDPAARRPIGLGPAIDSQRAPSPPGRGPEELPPPRGSDLLTESLPFDRASLVAAIDRLYDSLEDLGAELTTGRAAGVAAPGTAAVLAAVAALELARRWRNRADRSLTRRRAPRPPSGPEEFPGWPGLWPARMP
jgi:hypothetical protein